MSFKTVYEIILLHDTKGNNKVTREYMKGINAHTELHYYIN